MARSILLLPVLIPILQVVAQPGHLDPTFNPIDHGHGHGAGANNVVLSALAQSDGRTIIGGLFTQFEGQSCPYIARVNVDGTHDPAFLNGGGPNAGVWALAQQPDGKVVVAGSFTEYNGVSRSRIARLFPDGTLDPSFDPGVGPNATITRIIIAPDGRILVLGSFSFYNGALRPQLARLNTDGTLDNSLNPGTGFTGGFVGQAHAMALQPDGKILVGGDFSTYNGNARNNIVRLNSNGTQDFTFDVNNGGPNGEVRTIAIQNDGRIIVGGTFSEYSSVPRSNIARLNTTGLTDATFTASGTDGAVSSSHVLPDGKILIGGAFESYNGTLRRRLLRLNVDGTLDPGFDPGRAHRSGTVLAFAPHADGRTVLGGDFDSFAIVGHAHVRRINDNGSEDVSFSGTGVSHQVTCMAVQSDDRMLIGGPFDAHNGSNSAHLARLLPDGAKDPAFEPGAGVAGSSVNAIVVQPDGKILIGGEFLMYDLTVRRRIARLHANGSLDNSFLPGFGPNAEVRAIAVQTDGKLVVAGDFTDWNGTACQRIVRLNADGSLDGTFSLSGADGPIHAVIIRSDGRMYVGGAFTTMSGFPRNRVARIQVNGGNDAAFTPGTGADGEVHALAIDGAGGLLIGGTFTNYNGTPCGRMARLLATGDLDASYITGSGANDAVEAIVMQADGKALVAGHFIAFNGTARERLARLQTNGALDPTFSSGGVMNGSVNTIARQSTGKVVIGGAFTVHDGVGRNRISRVHGTNDLVRLRPRLWLEGPFDSDSLLMSDDLRSLTEFPLEEPYTALGYAHAIGGGAERMPTYLLHTSGANAIVDWVLVELRSIVSPGIVLSSRSGLLQRDGDVVDLDGVSPLVFPVAPGLYKVAVKHRNHLGCMTGGNISLQNSSLTTVDLRTGLTSTFGTDARKTIGSARALWAGDVTFNGQIKYTGGGNDRDPILVRIGGNVPTAVTSGYHQEDVNMTGEVKYAGSGNDRDIILQNIGGTVPSNVRVQQLP
ncbi:MAG: delta-60 repeat domain-containing protein [Flavobacteriales bacterium]|nr:delta-60 repeat domain-containing protein [Flavobacteriales bacterium]